MERSGPLRIGIVGAGRLGWSLGPALVRAGYTVAAVAGRSPASTEALAEAIGDGVRPVFDLADALGAADLVFLTVPDEMVRPVADSLPWQPGHLAVHCSGALSLDVLSAAAAAGAETGTFHPIQSFPSRRPEPERFTHIYCGVEGTGILASILERVALDIGAKPLSLAGVNRSLYHAAAVFASNDLVALMSAASRTWALAGLDEGLAREALSPLLTATAANLARLDLGAALTGPVARGDTGTIRSHLQALSGVPDLRELYRRLGAELLLVTPHDDIALRKELEDLLKPQTGT